MITYRLFNSDFIREKIQDIDYEITSYFEFSLTHYASSIIENTLTFAETEFYFNKALNNKNINCIITTKNYVSLNASKSCIITDYPKLLFFRIHQEIAKQYDSKQKNEISTFAEIHPTAIIGENVHIGAYTKIGPYSIINNNTYIGNNVIIEDNVTIGARGLNNTLINNTFLKVPDLGYTIIGDNVEILSKSIIQKPYFLTSTKLENGVHISVAVVIGHDCKIGENTIIAGKASIAGFTYIGKNVWVGPNAVVSNLLTIDDFVKISIGSCVVTNIKENQIYSGNFAMPHTKNMKRFIKELKND